MTKILVVDDDPVNLKLAVFVLKKAGYEVHSATGGAEGVELATAHLPDLVLMDIQMPGMDGVAALNRLRADPHTAALKVAAFTGLGLPGENERLITAGFDAYFTKPFRYDEFVASIATLLKGEQK